MGKALYCLKGIHQNVNGFLVFIWIVLSVVALHCVNELLTLELGITHTPMPWRFLQVLWAGYLLPTLIAVVMITTPIVGVIFWRKGGVGRAIATYIGGSWLAVIALSSLAVYAFTVWYGLALPAYPWMMVRLWMHLRTGTAAYTDFMICVLGSFSLLGIAVIARYFSAKTKAEKVFGQAHFASAFEMAKAGVFADEGIVLGKAHGKILRMPGYEGALVVAPTGGGKTSAIAVPNLLEWRGSGVFNDLKGELYDLTAEHREKALGNKCYRFAPADVTKNTACYNPFYYVSDNPDLRIRDLQLIAETLIPAEKLGDGFWYQSSRELFLTLSLYLLDMGETATLEKIHDLSKQEKFFLWLKKEITLHQETLSTALLQNAYSILGTDEKTRKNILKDFHSRLGLFNDPLVCDATNSNDFDLRYLRREKMSIYIQIPDGDKERLSPLLTLFWAQLIHVLSELQPGVDEPHGVLALMDEFGNMARINKLREGMSFLRSYHVRPIIIVQYLAQIYSVYGRDDAKGFLNSKIKVVFALNDPDDAEFFSRSLGTKTVKVSSSSVSTGQGDRGSSRSSNMSYQSLALMSPDEIMQLSNKKAIIIMEAKNPIKANKCYWFLQCEYYRLIEKLYI